MMDLIQQKLPPNWKIVGSSKKPLTSVGDNYGSSINSVTVSLENETTNEEETLQLIAKMCPTDPGLCQAFQVDKTFVKEAAMYTDVAPLLRAYQVEKGLPGDQLIDSFIECFGARQSLDPTKDTVDSEAVLLLENLNYKGFRVGERSKGFNLKDTEFILRHLAQFHSVLIAFQRDRPESFKDKVLPYLNKLDLVAGMDQQILKRMREEMFSNLQSIPEIAPLVEIIRRQVEICQERVSNTDLFEESPFNTFCHGDLWVNNMMIAYSGDQPKEIKFFDFQFIKYGSVAEDIVFFLFASLENSVLKEHFDHLLDVYYSGFSEYLQLHGVSLDDFSRESFLKEINYYGKYELIHILSMSKVFFMDKKKMAEMNEFDTDSMFNKELVGPDYFEKLKIVVLEFQKRGWLME